MIMCAIAGILGLKCDYEDRQKMMRTMGARGPDENGSWSSAGCTLLHSRLAIIDPDGGKQPMHLSYGAEDYIIVYNGEIYNTDEVRNELKALGHVFQGHSDTEVMLHAYAQWGEAALEKVNGIFGLAIWESKKHKLFLARDRMGVKPVFYKEHCGGFLFASEIKTILAYPSVKAEINEVGAAELLLLGPGRTPGSGILKGIYELEPGCCGCYRDGKWSWRRYWKLIDSPHTDTFDQTVEKVRYLVTDSIRRQMVADCPLGTFLSGGLDSSIISSVCAKEMASRGEQLQTFSLDYQNNEKFFVPEKFKPDTDNAFIACMQEYLDTKQHWTILKTDDLVSALKDATIARDLPGMADVDFSLLLFCKQIRTHVKVALSGECADEIFGGYPWFRDPEVRAVDGFPWAQNTKYRSAFLAPWLSGRIDSESFVYERYTQTLTESDILPNTSEQERRMKQMVNLNQRWFMQTLLDRKDRMSMYCGLEVRVPFCDYRVAEYLYTVPWDFKDHGGQEKGLLRCAVKDLIPEAVLHRKKSPYPKTYDPNYYTAVREMLMQVLLEKDAPIFQLVRREMLESLLSAEYAWPWYGQLMRVPQTIAYMLQLNFWMVHYGVSIV